MICFHRHQVWFFWGGMLEEFINLIDSSSIHDEVSFFPSFVSCDESKMNLGA